MSDEHVGYELRDTIAVIRMDDGKVNALSPAMLDNLQAAFARAQDEARAVALFGRPDRFSAGFDLKVMMSGPDNLRALVEQGCEFLMRVYEHPQPVVVGCTGHAIAAGVMLVATADQRIGVNGPFKLGLNELERNIPVPVFGYELARDRLDPRAFIQATLQAAMYSPEDALRVGWLDEVVAPDALEDRVMAEAKRLAKLSGKAYALTKKSIRQRTIDHVRASLQANLETFRVG